MTSGVLISPKLISQMRKIANKGLQTRVTLLRRIEPELDEGIYGDDTETWATVDEYDGWMHENKLKPADTGAGYVVTSIGDFRLHLKAEVEVFIGDIIVIDGEEFHVQDTNKENTYRVFMTCLLRRRQ